jgi:hypothetical protein
MPKQHWPTLETQIESPAMILLGVKTAQAKRSPAFAS